MKLFKCEGFYSDCTCLFVAEDNEEAKIGISHNQNECLNARNSITEISSLKSKSGRTYRVVLEEVKGDKDVDSRD